MEPYIEISDPIHKRILIHKRERRILDHPFVQRLRHIRQLGFVSWVYPAATHDRFSHSVGTLHVAGIIAEQIFENEEISFLARALSREEKTFLKEIVRLAGLLHDIGHAPFSHTAERVMPLVEKLKLPALWLANPRERRIATHEDYTALLLAGLAQGAARELESDEAEIIASLVHHKKIKIPASWKKHFSPGIETDSLHRLARSLVSSDIDADRMDYLLRDSHFAGVVYGQVDIPWLISNLGSVKTNDGYLISISEQGIHALEHYLFARYHMYVQVYMHKTVKCFEHYFARAIEEGETEYRIPADRDDYAALRDSTILEGLFAASALHPNSWASRLMRRAPAKRVARIWDKDEETKKLFAKLERELKQIGVTPFLVTSKRKFLDLPPASLGTMDTKPQGLFQFGLSTMPLAVVRRQFGISSIAPVGDYSFVLKEYHEDISITDIYILPEDYAQKEPEIREIIKKFRVFSESEVAFDEPAGN